MPKNKTHGVRHADQIRDADVRALVKDACPAPEFHTGIYQTRDDERAMLAEGAKVLHTEPKVRTKDRLLVLHTEWTPTYTAVVKKTAHRGKRPMKKKPEDPAPRAPPRAATATPRPPPRAARGSNDKRRDDTGGRGRDDARHGNNGGHGDDERHGANGGRGKNKSQRNKNKNKNKRDKRDKEVALDPTYAARSTEERMASALPTGGRRA